MTFLLALAHDVPSAHVVVINALLELSITAFAGHIAEHLH